MTIKFEVIEDKNNNILFLTDAKGYDLIHFPLLNKGTAFTKEERETFGLNGLLPPRILTMGQQIEKINERYHRLGKIQDLYKSCKKIDEKKIFEIKKELGIARYNFLRDLQDRNELLFYAFIYRYMEDVLPIIYTPTVGEAVLRYSRDSSRFRGIFLSSNNIENADKVFDCFRFKKPKIAVVTDNQGILGLGDQGVGGMNIPIGKLALYVLGAGIKPWETLPLNLDVGTDNKNDLDDPYYLGYKADRLKGAEYGKLLDNFIRKIRDKFPDIIIQWEDLSRQNAFTILDKYRDVIPSFNDDIQGTGSMALAGIINGLRCSEEELKNQRFVIYGAGAGGIGIARQISKCLQTRCKIAKNDSIDRIAVIDSMGLVTEEREVEEYKKQFSIRKNVYNKWIVEDIKKISLIEVIKNFQPTVLIGTSGQYGHFTEEVIKSMIKNKKNPIIMPLSNPSSNSEATPYEIFKYSGGKAIVATGSPYEKFQFKGANIVVGQGNNFYIFPGVGLGIVLSKGRFVSDEVFTEVAYTLSKLTPDDFILKGIIYPDFNKIREISANIAHSTVNQIAEEQDAVKYSVEEIKARMWKPSYHKISFQN